MTSLAIETDVRARAVSVQNGWVCVQMEDDREISFPIHKSRCLGKATAQQVANVDLICGGTGLHLPDLDEDLSVQGIIEGRFG